MANAEAPPEEQIETIEFGLWWPSADPDELRQAARAWETMAGALDDTERELRGHASGVTGPNRGQAVDAFGTYVERWTGDALPTAAENCRAIAAAFSDYAEAVDEVRGQIRQMAIEIAATVAVGVGLAWLTAGLSAGAAAGITATMVARAGLLASSMAARVIAICSRIAVFAGVGAIEGGAANLVIQTGRNAITNDNHDPFDGYDVDELGWSVAFGAGAGGAFGGLRSIPLMRGVEPAVDSSRLPLGVIGRAMPVDDIGISGRGLVPAAGTRTRPPGLPEHWRIVGTRGNGGTRYVDPSNPGNSVRVMQEIRTVRSPTRGVPTFVGNATVSPWTPVVGHCRRRTRRKHTSHWETSAFFRRSTDDPGPAHARA